MKMWKWDREQWRIWFKWLPFHIRYAIHKKINGARKFVKRAKIIGWLNAFRGYNIVGAIWIDPANPDQVHRLILDKETGLWREETGEGSQ